METQPAPKRNNYLIVQDQVIADMQERRDFGVNEYGTGIQPFNGRSSPQEVYEEELDKIFYIKQWMIERAEIIEALHKISEAASLTAAQLTSFVMLVKMGEIDEMEIPPEVEDDERG